METNPQRILWLDIAKGIGIVLVVAAHCLNLSEWPFQIIYTFHMPLFFFLSGYLFRNGQPFLRFFVKRIKTLLVPFLCFFLVGLAISLLIPDWRSKLTMNGIKEDLVLANPNAVHNSSIWFLVCMFFVQIFFWMIAKTPKWAQAVLLIALYALGILYSVNRFHVFGYNRLPLDLDAALIAIVFYAAGYYAREAGLIDRMTGSVRSGVFCLIISSAVMTGCYLVNGYSNLHGLRFGNPALYLAGGLAGTIAVIALAKLVSLIPRKIKAIPAFYGRNSLMIMGIQSISIRLMILLFKYNGITLKMYQFPHRYSLLFTVILLGIWCPLVCFIWNRLRAMKTIKSGGKAEIQQMKEGIHHSDGQKKQSSEADETIP